MGVPAQSLVPVLVSGGLSFVQISAGWTHVSMRELVGVAGVMRGVVLLCTIRRALGQNCMIPSLMPFAPPPHTHTPTRPRVHRLAASSSMGPSTVSAMEPTDSWVWGRPAPAPHPHVFLAASCSWTSLPGICSLAAYCRTRALCAGELSIRHGRLPRVSTGRMPISAFLLSHSVHESPCLHDFTGV